MTIAAGSITATLLEGAGVDLGRVDGTVTLDEAWSPHVQADLTISMPDEATLDLLDPREQRRVRIDSTVNYPGTVTPPKARSFDLGLRGRVIDHAAGEVRLSLTSDEALLMDDVWLDDEADLSGYSYQTSIRDLVDHMLDRIGASLEPGTADAPVDVRPDATNLVPNPSFEVDISNTTLISGVAARDTAWSAVGAASIRFGGTASSSCMAPGADSGALRLGMQPGKTYTVSAVLRLTAPLTGAEDTARSRSIVALTRIGAGAYVETRSNVAPNVAGITQLSVTFTVPTGATEAFIRLYNGHASGNAWWDAIMVREVTADPTDTGYFDGATADTTAYNYAFTGSAGITSSTRTALHGRDVDALRWEPGVSSWDYLQPLWQSLGFRLFCDEERKWYLVDGSTFVADGALQLSMPGNLHRAEDTIERDSNAWFDAVVARYRWRDSDTGAQREAIDAYGPPGYTKVQVIDLDRAYVGPGFASYAVARASGRGRTANLVALADLGCKASQPLQVDLIDTPTLVGVVRTVRYDLADGTMTVASRGLTDLLPGAIDLLAGTIDSLAGTIDSL